ncbi:SdpI family protein [Clostridium peptidivorans]|uniref:SdpI family protein n=1 Tax=Clostridium peptidivorans TaxID=100174 RepID=UPI000BE28DC7|nr:SdpI family protein [Clostridium peptidivorans]
MRKFDFTRVLFLTASIIILFLGFLIPESNLAAIFMLVLIIILLVIFDIRAAKITKLSEDNPKVRTVRNINRMIMAIIVICFLFIAVTQNKSISSSKNNELIIVGLISVFIMAFGNVSPKIPFNRYLGLRLPWTIRDEETWKIAHKVLGYVSFPLAIIQFILVFFFSMDKVTTASILTWIAIPGLYSLRFYYKKMKNSV